MYVKTCEQSCPSVVASVRFWMWKQWFGMGSSSAYSASDTRLATTTFNCL